MTSSDNLSCGLFNKTRVPSVTIVIFGITGDLAMRKLFPALYNLTLECLLPDDFIIVGVARSATSKEKLLERFKKGISSYSRSGLENKVFEKIASKFSYCQVDYNNPDDYKKLASVLKEGTKNNKDRIFIHYLSTPPTAFPHIIKELGQNGLISKNTSQNDIKNRVVFEKPFGRDLETALSLDFLAKTYLKEEQIFRMDHYLGKETVQNILVFRFANSIFEPLWNRRYVNYIKISVHEKIGIEGRGRFYEDTGIIRDVVQNHLLQILALIAMEAPASFETEAIRDERFKVFKSFLPITKADFKENVRLGQYKGYLEEPDVSPSSKTPTSASIKLYINNWRWAQVPFILSAGKALDSKETKVEICFSNVPLCLFGSEKVCSNLQPNILTIRIQPEEGITLRIGAKTPGNDLDVTGVDMKFNFNSSFNLKTPQDAYEKLLLDCLKGSQTLFARQDEIEQMWSFVAPVLEGAASGEIPLMEYEKNSKGMLVN